MIEPADLTTLIDLIDSDRYTIKTRRMKFPVDYGDVYIRAFMEGRVLVLETQAHEMRRIPLSDLSRISFMPSGNIGLMCLMPKMARRGPNRIESGMEETDGIVLSPSD